MKTKKNVHIQPVIKFLPIFVCIIFVMVLSGKEITVQTILDYTPEKPLYAAFAILLLYALKSISFVFPIVVIQIATGHLFHTATALFINFLGRIITITIPYWIGRISSADMIGKLAEKYPKLQEITSDQKKSPRLISFLLRTFCFLPGDAVSMYLGAIKTPFLYYLEGGVLGTALGVVLSTVFGSSITEPNSPAFWLSALLMALMAAISLLFYIKRRIRK